MGGLTIGNMTGLGHTGLDLYPARVLSSDSPMDWSQLPMLPGEGQSHLHSALDEEQGFHHP